MQTYKIFAYNTRTNMYAHLDDKEAHCRSDALYEWVKENPIRNGTLEATPDIKVVALLEVGGI